jgi:hypothetical protein
MSETLFNPRMPLAERMAATSALVVCVDVNVWTATKQDRAISNEVTTSKKASADAGKFTKNLLLGHSPDHKALLNYRQTVYNWLQRSTYDWAGSARLLPTINLEKFKSGVRQHEVAFTALLDKFITVIPAASSAMRRSSKATCLVVQSTLKSQDVRSKFRMKFAYMYLRYRAIRLPKQHQRSNRRGLEEELRASGVGDY